MPESTAVNTNQNHMTPFSSSTTPSAIVIDGAEEDAILAKSELLTRYEVLKRRARRMKQLSRIYKDHYWSLMEDLRIRYRDYYWEYGKSPFLEDEEGNDNNNNNLSHNLHHVKVENEESNADNSGYPNKNGSSSSRLWCVAHMCKNKAMPLTRFCHMHILFDTEQKLYKPCNFTVKSSPTGPLMCGKPTLRSTVPTYCPPHFQKAEKYVARALKKAGLNVSSTSKTGPKFHVLVSEYVRQIQTKRRTVPVPVPVPVSVSVSVSVSVPVPVPVPVQKKTALLNVVDMEDEDISC